MRNVLLKYDVVLLGVGHTNAHVLRMWKMGPIPDARLTCVSNLPVVTYSGMLPGVLAGQYPRERMEIDLVRLCAAASARLIVDEVTGLDVAGRRLLFDDRPPLPFDVLSIGIGSVPTQEGVEADDTLLAIKPMQTFLERLEQRLRDAHEAAPGRALRTVVVGGGAGGVEIAFCLPPRVRKAVGDATLELTLINSDDELPGGTRPKTQTLVERELRARGVNIRTHRRVTRLREGTVTLDDGETLQADLVLWATGADAPPLLEAFDLPKDSRGFLLTDSTLRSTSGAPIFAVGDTGTIENAPTPKAGVYAVRQGPVLWENLHRLLQNRPLQRYVPQRGFLKLFNTGDGQAIGEYRWFSFRGGWCWKLKDFIDGRFMDKHQHYELPEMTLSNNSTRAMRCAGCGGKIGGSVLSRVLKRLDVPTNEHVLLGLDQPDDAAILKTVGGRPLTVTADFFTAPLDDPFLTGRIAALNAASDLFAMGAQPTAALALVTLPPGPERQQEQLLYELLAGSLRELRSMNAALVGGHTIEGPNITIGFAMLADQRVQPPRTKAGLKAGDALLLTKPLGTGVLLAALMQAQCRAEWYGPLLKTMLAGNAQSAAVADEFQLAATTDVTGFGLAGHLMEMLDAGGVDAVLSLDDLPLLPGTAKVLESGLESTLAPANRAVEARIQVTESRRHSAAYRALFDPQTGGGLLLAVPQANVDAILERLSEAGGIPAALIGRAIPRSAQPQAADDVVVLRSDQSSK